MMISLASAQRLGLLVGLVVVAVMAVMPPVVVAAQIDPAAMEQAQQKLDAGELRTAMIILRKALQEVPGDGGAQALLGRVYLSMGEPWDAKRSLIKARKLGVAADKWVLPLALSMFQLDESKELLGLIDPAGFSDEKVKADAYVVRGEAYLNLGETKLGIEELMHALDYEPNHLRGNQVLAEVDIRLQRYQSAQAFLNKLQLYHPGNAQTLFLMGQLAFQKQDFAQAKTNFREAIKLNASKIEAQLGLAWTLVSIGDFQGARAAADEAAGLAKENSENFFNARYLQALSAYSLGDLDTADTLLADVLKQNVPDIRARLLAAELAVARQGWNQAVEISSGILQDDPQNQVARDIKAASQFELGLLSAAIKTYTQSPGLPIDFLMLAKLVRQMGNTKDADLLVDLLKLLAKHHPEVGDRLEKAARHMQLSEKRIAVNLILVGLMEEKSAEISHQLADGKVNQAMVLATRLRDQFPKVSHFYVLLGNVNARIERYELAESLYKEALKVNPKDSSAMENLGRLALQRGRLDEAASWFDRALLAEPTRIEPRRGLAHIAALQQHPQEARAQLEAILADKPDDVQARTDLARYFLKQGKPAKAESLLRPLAQSEPENASVLSVYGASLAAGGDLQAARRLLQRAVNLDPDNGEAWLELAKLHRGNGKAAGAEEFIFAALAEHPGSEVLARVLIKLSGQRNDASADFVVAKRLQAETDAGVSAIGHEYQGDLLAASSRWNSAAKQFAKAMRLRPRVSLGQKAAGAYLRQGDQKKLEKFLREWEELQPDSLVPNVFFGDYLAKSGKFGRALSKYRKGLEKDPKNVVVLNQMAEVNLRRGEVPKAVDLAQKALAVNPDYGPALDSFGWAQVKQGEIDAALASLQRAVQAMPNSAEVQYHYAVALFKSGDRAAAAQALNQALASGENFYGRNQAEALRSAL